MADTKRQQTYRTISLVRTDGKGYDFENVRDTNSERLEPQDAADTAVREKWEIMLGHFLKEQLARKGDSKEYKLRALPKGFELRFVRKTSDAAKKDYFLYGHPIGRTYKYRSPTEFFPHLMWLVSDTKFRSVCSCDFCNRMVKRDRQRAPAIPQALATKTLAAPGQSQQQMTNMSVEREAAANHASSQTQPAPVTSMAKLPAIRAGAPGTTCLSDSFRLGEMIWYQHKAWRLGVIVQVLEGPRNGTFDEAQYKFEVAPLGHRALSQSLLTREVREMRPFLSFSVPTTSNPVLSSKTYFDVNWPALCSQTSASADTDQQRNYQLMVLGLEASKMAARAVNDSFSVFSPTLQVPNPNQPAPPPSTFMGAYFGAEMMHVGDAVRVIHMNTPSCVMAVGVVRVVEAGGRRALELEGHIYCLARLKTQQVVTKGQLGTFGGPFADELRARIGSEAQDGLGWAWQLVEAGPVVKSEAEILGRFYVTHKLLRILDPEGFERARGQGMPVESGGRLNSRQQSGNGATSDVWRGFQPSRKATFGESLGYDLRLPLSIVEDASAVV